MKNKLEQTPGGEGSTFESSQGCCADPEVGGVGWGGVGRSGPSGLHRSRKVGQD